MLVLTVQPGRRAAKVLTIDGRTLAYDAGVRFDAHELRCASLAELATWLRAHDADPSTCLVRGMRSPTAPTSGPIFRRSRAAPAHIAPCARRVLCLDVDDCSISPGLEREAAARAVLRAARLPDCLVESSCVAQESVSSDRAAGRWRGKIWFWCDRPLGDREALDLLRDAAPCVDRALYRPAQIHYTCRTLVDGTSIEPGDTVLELRGTRQESPDVVPIPGHDYRAESSRELARVLDDVRTAKLSTRHKKINAGAYHLGRFVALGVLDHEETRRTIIRTAIESGLDAERADDETTRALRDGIDRALRDGVGSWRDTLLRCDKSGAIKTCQYNVERIVTCDPRYEAWWDSRADCARWADGRQIEDHDAVAISQQIGEEYRISTCPYGTILSALMRRAHLDRRDVYRDAIEDLEWDGTARLDDWLTRYAGAESTPFARAAGRAWVISLVARAIDPGCQVDHMLVLEGEQGRGKTSLLRAIGAAIGGPTDRYGRAYVSIDLSLDDRAIVEQMAFAIVVEAEELAGIDRRSDDRLKRLITTSVDRYRAPYARVAVDRPRGCVIAGTTNKLEGYLRDPSGNRRYWPVRVGAIDLPAWERDVRQVLAEAVVAYRMGEPWHLRDASLRAAATEQQMARTSEDTWTEHIERILRERKPTLVTASEIVTDYVGVPLATSSAREVQRAARILRALGWAQTRSARARAYAPPAGWYEPLLVAGAPSVDSS